ncbi:type VII secretion protein EccCb [Nocardioides panacisoli]|uniref:type VII secretion protein EccCb n=1 Tax=Nocardioides panacisoli TaxID=627624 RepID=UPI001C62AF28|nr:type VII secretion protein EccCb [Nocardioides panacisoli]QYJ03664.1 type VII secretion protein EccCb [Nocardioides panacisoli]
MNRTHEEPPPLPRVELRPPPPQQPREGAAGLALNALPMLGSVGSIVLVASLGGASTVTRFLAAGMFAGATLGFVAVQVDRQRRQHHQRVGSARRSYLRHLAVVRRTVREVAADQRRSEESRHPPPAALARLVAEGSRVGERRPGDPDFWTARVGVGDRPLAADLVVPGDDEVAEADPATAAALHRFVAVHARQPDLPVVLDLADRPRRALGGADARGRARALLCQVAVLHDPAHVGIEVVTDDASAPAWEWVKWLPHARGARRPSVEGGPTRLLVVVDADDGADSPTPADQPAPGTTVVTLDPTAGAAEVLVPDRMSVAAAEAVARRLAGRSTAGPTATGDYLDLLGTSPSAAPRRRTVEERLRVPIGLDDAGRPVHLDLKEAAQGGMGPHGLVVGATGSGKSEFLRTLVLGLALTHTPEELNLVLVDFKGGATFAGMADLPHASAVITNLARELTLVERMQDALAGELTRRQELLREAGNLASLRDYDRARAEGADLPPLPALFIVVDEFSELLAARPEFLDLFVAIGRLGRSLGLHLLLASQRLEEGRLRGLDSHLSYRVGLRTFSAAESRTAIGVADAHTLPAEPGIGYLRPDPATLTRFRAAYVSGARAAPAPVVTQVVPFTAATRDTVDAERPAADSEAPTLLAEAVAALRRHRHPAHRIWLPPLATPPTLDELDRADEVDAGPWAVPIGIVDRPRAQRRDPLVLDLSGAGGHVAVVGAARSGASTLLQTLVAGLAQHHGPRQVQFFVLDLGGGGFGPWAHLPHVSGVATRHQPDVVRRAVAQVTELLAAREAGLADEYGEVFVVVDGWGALRAEYADEAAALQEVAARGLGVGVHLVASAQRWADFRGGLRDAFGTRLELRLGDPMDSEVDRRRAAAVPTGRPGRGLTAAGEHFLAALPRVDGVADPDASAHGLADLVERSTSRWPGERAPALRLLPDVVAAEDLTSEGDDLVVGLAESTLAPVGIDVTRTPHLLVLGEGGSGRSATLRTWVRAIERTRGADRAQLVLVDPRRSLGGELPDDFVLHHLTSAAQAEPALQELADYLTTRLPGPDVTPRQLRERSWWTGAEVFVVVDDHDLLTLGGRSPLTPLLPLLPQAGDVGLRLAVARRSGGAARALHEPVLQALRDLAAPGLLLSGSPDEGPLLAGVRAAPAPPGRGRLVTREDGVRTVQVAWTEPTA